MPILAALLFAGGLILLWWAARRRAAEGMPRGRLVYVDTRGLKRVETPLHDPATNLTGRPDYLIKQGGKIIPVEIKSGRCPSQPYAGHLLQLAAYCLLAESTFGRRPPHGVIKYADGAFEVDYSPELEEWLMDVMARMRRSDRRAAPSRSHHSSRRCRVCGYREVCEASLV